MTRPLDMEITDDDLRANHGFVMAFETLRKEHGFREMSDDALRLIAGATGVTFEDLRVCRHIRNAIAHGEAVSRNAVRRCIQILLTALNPAGAQVSEAEVRVDPGPWDRSDRAEPERAVRIHAWRDDRLEQEMIANGFVSVGDEEISDLTGETDSEVIRSVLLESMPDRKPRAIANFVGYWKLFLWTAQIGDLVVLPTRSRYLAIGEFAGDYFYVPTAHPRARHRRAVAWLATAIDRGALDEDLLKVIGGRPTIQEFKSPGAVGRLRTLASSGIDPGLADSP